MILRHSIRAMQQQTEAAGRELRRVKHLGLIEAAKVKLRLDELRNECIILETLRDMFRYDMP